MPLLKKSPPGDAPQIPDHELVRCVGKGSYGEVWLARNVMGTYRGVKVVYRKTFDNDRPFDREYFGIRRFEPVSRTHPGLMAILHVGRNLAAGYYYYVMEVADDTATGQTINPDHYHPKTLGQELIRRGKLPQPECLQIALALTAALGHLHKQGLVHRDIKPANIIFINDLPKFADIGLVTNISDDASFVGTEGYIPPEGPGTPTADIYSFGKLLYEISMGKDRLMFPELPSKYGDTASIPELLLLNEIIMKACENNVLKRYQSAEEMHAALITLAQQLRHLQPAAALRPPAAAATRIEAPPTFQPLNAPAPGKTMRVAILYKSNVQPDGYLLQLLHERLARHACEVFIDKHLAIGVEWAREIEGKIRESDAAIVLLSSTSIHSEMIAYEVETAHQAAQQQGGKPRLLPVRLQLTGPLPSPLARILDALHYFLWENPQDDDRLVRELIRSLDSSQKASPEGRMKLESIGGAVPLESQFYVVRPTDQEFQAAMARRDSIVLVKGARQMGKTSLLARGLQQARQEGAKVVLTDFQKLNTSHLASVETFFLTLGDFLADQLGLAVLPEEAWDKRRSPNTNFERYLRREVLAKMSTHFVWGLDEVDRLFSCDFGSEVFGLFRSWHNERALDPSGPWSRLTLAIAYATEAHLFITDINQSPFNVGTRLTLDDFTLEQLADLNQRYGGPLKTPQELRALHELLAARRT